MEEIKRYKTIRYLMGNKNELREDGDICYYSDHKAVVEALQDENTTLEEEARTYAEKVDVLQNKIDELEKENKSLKGANETMNIVINNMEELGV